MHLKFIEHRESEKSIDCVNEWFTFCQKNAIPYITISTRKKFADVQWDYINFHSKIENKIDMLGDDFAQGMIEIFKKYANNKSTYIAGSRVAEFKNIEIPQARNLAKNLYDYIATNLKING